MIVLPGVNFDVEGPMLYVEATIDPVTRRIFGREAICTSARRQASPGGSSLHYEGLAIDLRTRDQPAALQRLYADQVQKLYGPGFDVVLEGPASLDDRYRDRQPHLHIEWDPDGLPWIGV